MPFAVGGKNSALPQISSFTICAHSKQFDPEKHGAICQELAKEYANAGTPLKVLEGYLSILTLSSFGGYSEKNFLLDEDAMKSSVPLGWVIESFGVEVVLLWTAMLLKKRVVVYSNKVTELQRLLRVLPALVWHRGNWNVMRPYILADDTGLADLQGVYCAGVTEPLESRQDLWDLYVDLPALSISVASAAKKDFTMTSVHKDLAGALTRAYAHGEGSNTSLVDVISEKTNGVISKLEILAEAEVGRVLTAAALQEQLSNAALSHFLFGVALAERLATDAAATRGEEEEEEEQEEEEATLPQGVDERVEDKTGESDV
eukprot:CAMPEP_0179442054 /NCGR_PEP_ID=MMETSP0799-20121207/25546_1 /TAXON_ID=46947 /ORGANISM="Geminigera cryophila, Strain CCMP2564" /LENGTH=316 /DNA_ID=CAMNT_0021226805 /DNA_START=54 /DNA_END=1004 /DNA_ORIENTATION=+